MPYQFFTFKGGYQSANISYSSRWCQLHTYIVQNPYEQLVPENSSSGVLQLVRVYLSNSALAYVAVVDTHGRLINKISAPGINPPVVKPENSKSLWLTEHQLFDAERDVEILEFRVPILVQGTLAGYIRTGYYLPNFGIPQQQLSFLAQRALPIFLLMMFFYFLVRREILPMQQANEHICELIQDQELPDMSVNASGELKDFIQNFNYFISLTQKRLLELESDNTKAKTSGNLLAYHKRQVESVLQTIPDAVVVIDESGSTTFANQKLESLIGIPIESVIGKFPHEWCPDQDVIALLARYHGNVTPLHRIEPVKYCPQDFPGKTIAVSAFPLFSPKNANEILGTLVIFRDVSTEIQLRESRDKFISHVSHELKSPLNIMLSQTELLSEFSDGDSSEAIESINVIQDEIERLSILIDDLLNVTKVESDNIIINRQRVKMQEFLNDTFNSAVRGAESKGITTEISIARSISTLNIDKELFRIAINNLLTNAIKYSNSGDTVTLEADLLDDCLQIKIGDTGIGMSEEDREHIFEKFYRSEREEVRARPGHGLGLALSKAIIALHKGEISVESTLNRGSSFIVRIIKTSTYLKEAS